MKSLKEWRALQETIAPAVTPEEEQPNQEDYGFYHANIYGRVKRYLDWLVAELEKTGPKLNMVRKGFIIQEIMDALGLNAAQVARLSSNIKRGMQQQQQPGFQQPQAQPQTPVQQPQMQQQPQAAPNQF